MNWPIICCQYNKMTNDWPIHMGPCINL